MHHIKYLVLMVSFLLVSGCESTPAKGKVYHQDLRLGAAQFGGFRLGMTPAAALRVVEARNYTEDTSNLATFGDLVRNRFARGHLKIIDIPAKKTEDRYIHLMSEQSYFLLQFEGGRLLSIDFKHDNISKSALLDAMQRLDRAYDFVTNRTQGASVTTWNYQPEGTRANLRLDFFEKPDDALLGFLRCSYGFSASDYFWFKLQ